MITLFAQVGVPGFMDLDVAYHELCTFTLRKFSKQLNHLRRHPRVEHAVFFGGHAPDHVPL